MTRAEFWQQCYLSVLNASDGNPVRAASVATAALEKLDGLSAGPVGAVPVYRLRKDANYLFTASTVERDSAIATYGFVLEGIAFYAYPP